MVDHDDDGAGPCPMEELLPVTGALLEASPYPPLDEPAQAIAERLVMCAHLAFDEGTWSGRLSRYWGAFGENLAASANAGSVAEFWCRMRDRMPLAPLSATGGVLHEKNLLCHPRQSLGVDDEDVLDSLRRLAPDLVDRARVWVRERRRLEGAGVWDAPAHLGAAIEEEQL